MPKTFEKDGYRFFFYTSGGEAVFDIEECVELRDSYGLKVQELAKAQRLAEEHRQLIVDKWHENIARHRP